MKKLLVLLVLLSGCSPNPNHTAMIDGQAIVVSVNAAALSGVYMPQPRKKYLITVQSIYKGRNNNLARYTKIYTNQEYLPGDTIRLK